MTLDPTTRGGNPPKLFSVQTTFPTVATPESSVNVAVSVIPGTVGMCYAFPMWIIWITLGAILTYPLASDLIWQNQRH